MLWSFAYLAVRKLLALVWLLARPRRSKELEILVLRHELAMLRRRARQRREAVSRLRQYRQQKTPICRELTGGDGTRTRDLRRDRLLRGSRRLTTSDAESLYSCDFAPLALRFRVVERNDFRRLLPGSVVARV